MAITNKISCWLWNQMFQYALGRYLSIKNRTELKLDITEYNTDKLRTYELNKFNIQEHFAKQSEIPLYKIRNINKIKNSKLRYIVSFILNLFIYKILVHIIPWYIQETIMPFDKKIYNLVCEDKDIYLSGHRQSHKYFDEIRGILLKDFEIKEKLDAKNQEIVSQMEKSDSVWIHFRRWDYVTQVSFFRPNLIACWLDYYHNATKYIEKKIKNPTYFIFSDDPEWVKKNFKTDKKCIFINQNTGENAYKDMILMSKCKHNIIANSSFSRWWARLNNHKEKIVVAPKHRFNKNSMNRKFSDMYCDDRIKI